MDRLRLLRWFRQMFAFELGLSDGRYFTGLAGISLLN